VRALRHAYGLGRSLVTYYGQVWRNAGRRRFYSQFVSSGDLAFDIGAHVGDRVRTWLQLGARVVAVEPQPSMLRVLRRLYGERRQVAIEPVAVGSKVGKATLHVSSATPTVSTLSSAWIQRVQEDVRFQSTRWDETVEVEVTTLEQLIAQHGVPRFIKVDVEGLELEVFKGLSRPIEALSFEYLPVSKSIAQDCVRLLSGLGPYRFRSSQVETMRWAQERWLEPAEMVDHLEGLPLLDGSGDVYARLGG
jgi:FkbM family methyltransferase